MVESLETPATSELLNSLSIRDPKNPFYTRAYAKYREATGFEAWVVGCAGDEGSIDACPAFLRVGWRASELELPSLPVLSRAELFWAGVQNLCRKLYVSKLWIQSFSSVEAAIPPLGEELKRTRRWEFVWPLQDTQSLTSMRKGHAYSVKQALKNGVVVRRSFDPNAAVDHARLMGAAMERRRDRGENVGVVADASPLRKIIESGAGCFYQAFVDESVVASNLILLANSGAYNHSQGIDARGREVGAAHFLLVEIAAALREQGIQTLNLGGTEAVESGLSRFKSGFSASISRIDLEAAEFRFSRGPLRTLFAIGKRLHRMAPWKPAHRLATEASDVTGFQLPN